MSRLPFELLLALRYLRPKRTFVSIITLISVLGVTLGVAVLIIVISVMSGFDSQLRDKILSFNAHLRITQFNPAGGQPPRMTNYALVARSLAANPQVKSVAPFVVGRVMLETEPAHGEGMIDAPFVRGIDPAIETNLSLFTSNLIGAFDLSGHGLVVGAALAANLRLRVGDRVAVYSPHDIENSVKEARRGAKESAARLATDFEVRGIFDAGYNDYNVQVILMSIDNAQDLYELGDDVNGLMVMLKDPYQAESVRRQFKPMLGPAYTITTWGEENNAMLAVMVEKNVMLYILFFIVIVASFGITCTLITFVVLKTREIGVLKALGASSRQVMWIFLSQSLVVSLLGVFVGSAGGMLALAYRNPFLHLMRRLTGLELFPADIYGFTELPALIIPGDIAIICGGSLIICLLAAAFPAWNASRLKPVEALRHG